MNERYKKYRKSLHPWLTNIPAHWQEHRAKVTLREVDERSESGAEELLSVSHMTGVTPRSQKNVTMFKAHSYTGHKLCRPQDIVVNTMWAWMGALGESKRIGIVSPSYGVYRTHKRNVFAPGFLDYLLRIRPYVSEYICRSTGIRSSRLRLYPDKFLEIPILQPSLPEQEKIVSYLRMRDREIGLLIKGKRQLIDLLDEQKHTIIHQFVTRGVDAAGSFRSSNIPALGEIPSHWDCKPIKAVAHVRSSNVDKHSFDDEIPVLLCNYTDVYNNDWITGEMSFMAATATEQEIEKFSLRVGDVILTKDSESPDDIGVPALVQSIAPDLICGYHLALLRPKEDQILGEFLFRVLSDGVIARQFHLAANGVTRFGLSQGDIKSALVPVPPIEEQQMICDALLKALLPIKIASDKAVQEIRLIREFRDRLVTDVVTGEMDLSNWEIPLTSSDDGSIWTDEIIEDDPNEADNDDDNGYE